MLNQLKYFFAALLSIPFLPVMYFQGKKVRANIPQLPEATGKEGLAGQGNKQLHLLTLGESTIAGVGVKTHQDGFTGALAQSLAHQTNSKIKWKVVAKSGYTARQVAEELIPSISDFTPDIIVIGLGANDAFELNSPRTWRKGMNAVLTGLNNIFPNAKIVCTNMPPIKEFPAFTPLIKSVIGNLVELLGEELDDLVQDFDNVFYVNEILKFDEWFDKFDQTLTIQDFFSDGVHPSELTYQTWGKEISNYIVRKNLLEPSAPD